MAEYKDFLPRVAYEVIGCPIPVMLNEIKESVINFCEESLAYTTDVEVTLVEGQRQYSLTLPVNQKVLRALRVTNWQGGILDTLVEETLPGHWKDMDGTPTGYFLTVDKDIVFYEKPREGDEGKIISVKLAIKPSKLDTTTTIPDWLYEDYEEGIAAGARHNLQMIRDKDWSSKKSAKDNLAVFKKHVTIARKRALQSYTDQSRFVTPRVFGGAYG